MVTPLDTKGRCRARSKRSGEQCRRYPTPGLQVCYYHGGSTPQSKAKAERNLAEGEANRLLTEGIYGGLANAEPVTDPVFALQRLAGLLGQMTESVGVRVNELKAIEAGEDLSKVRGQVALLDKLLGHFRAVLVDMNRLGIAQQRLALERDQAQLVGSGLIDGFHALALTPDQIELFMGAFRSRIKDQLTELGTGADRANGVLSPVDNPDDGRPS